MEVYEQKFLCYFKRFHKHEINTLIIISVALILLC